MIQVSNIRLEVSEFTAYDKKDSDPKIWTIGVNVTSNSREFLERIAQAIHRELAQPSAAPLVEEG